MRVKVFAAVAALSAVGGTALLAHDRPSRESRRERLEAARAEIGLSDEQVSEIRRIHGEARKAAVRRNADLRVARMELDELMGAATLDDARIQAKVKAIADLQAEAFRERTESQLAVRKLVTPEQFQKMQQLKHEGVRARRARPGRRGAPAGSVPGGTGGDDLAPSEPTL